MKLSKIYPKKILLCQQHQIGDVILSTACVRMLHHRFPTASIHFLTEKKCAPILKNNRYINKVWTIEKGKGIIGILSLYSQIHKECFDLVVDFQQLMRLKLAALVCRSAIKLSYPPKWYNKPFYSVSSHEAVGYAAKAKAGILMPLGIEWDGLPPEIYVTDKERVWAEDFLSKNGLTKGDFLITIDATHRRLTRKWPEKHYARLIHRISIQHSAVKFLMLYGPGEKETVKRIVEATGVAQSQCIIPDQQTSLRQLIALIQQADGHFGNCSAPRHIAVAVGTRSLIIHGSNKPGGWTYPSSKHGFIQNEAPGSCVSCNQSDCRQGTLDCLYGLEPDFVYERFRAFFLTGERVV